MTTRISEHDIGSVERLPIGFLAEFKLIRGLDLSAQLSFQRRLEDHIVAHGLQLGILQLQAAVWDDTTDLELADLADFLCWAIQQPEVCSVDLSEPRPIDGLDDIEGPRVTLRAYTLTSLAATVLYGFGDISAHAFIKALGGYVVPHPVG